MGRSISSKTVSRHLVVAILCSVVVSLPIRADSPGVEMGMSISRSDDFELFDELAAGYGPGLNVRWYIHDRLSADLSIAAFESDLADPVVFGQRIGSVRWYPVSLLAHVHFRRSGRFHPHLGAGLSYVLSDSSVASFEFRERLSLAPSVGATFDVDSRWRLSVDAKWLRFDGSNRGGHWSASQVMTSFGVCFRLPRRNVGGVSRTMRTTSAAAPE